MALPPRIANAVGVAQSRCSDDVIHGRRGPWKRMIGSEQDLAGTTHRNEMA